MAEKRQFPHHLIREIFEQPDGLRRTIEPRVSLEQGVVHLEEVKIPREELRAVRRINIVASGTSRHAGMTGQFMMQELAGVPVDVDYASEFEYRNPMIGPCELSIFITQSGETADTTGALREAKQRGSRVIAITNVAGSTIAREADGVIYVHAGPEVSIASTKAFTGQMACLFLFALYLGQVKEKVTAEVAKHYIRELLALPGKIETILASADQCEQLAERYHRVEDFMFLGRAIHYPIAMDGALKLKEISYIHAEGYPTGEAKHGPNALIDYRLPLVMIATCDPEDAGLGAALRKECQQHGRIQEAGRDRDRDRHARRHQSSATGESHLLCSEGAGVAVPDSGDCPPTTVCLLRRRQARAGCG